MIEDIKILYTALSKNIINLFHQKLYFQTIWFFF